MTTLRLRSRRLAAGLATAALVTLAGAATAEAATVYQTTTFTGLSSSLSAARQSAYSQIATYQQRYGNCYGATSQEQRIATASGYKWRVVLTAQCPRIA